MTVHCQHCGDEIVDDPEFINPRLGFEWCSCECVKAFIDEWNSETNELDGVRTVSTSD